MYRIGKDGPIEAALEQGQLLLETALGKIDLKSSSIVISLRLFVDKVSTGHGDPDYCSSIFYLSF